MLVTINDDRTIITVKSDMLSDFTAIVLKVSLGCELQESIEIAVEDVVVDEYELTAASLDLETFSQGVWGFVLTDTDGDTVTSEYRCLLADEDLTCKIAEYRNSTALEKDKLKVLADYIILKNASTCESDCEDFCLIYEEIADVLVASNC